LLTNNSLDGVFTMKKLVILFSLIALLAAGCATPAPSPTPVPAATATPLPPKPTQTPSPTLPPTQIPTITPTATPGAEMYSLVTFTEQIVCRMGPDVHYNPVVTYHQGDTAELNGRNEDRSWVMVKVEEKNKNLYCWAPITSIEDPGDLGGLSVPMVGKLPNAPLSLTATNGVCGTSPVVMILEWSPVAAGTGYRIYRNGKNIGTEYSGRFRDFDTPRASKAYVYTYAVQAFNAYGVSVHQASVSVTLCGK
jgi:hypothetical protein